MTEKRAYNQQVKKALVKAVLIALSAHALIFSILFILMLKGIIPVPFSAEDMVQPQTVIDYSEIDSSTTNLPGIGVENLDVKKEITKNVYEKFSNLSDEQKKTELKKAEKLSQKFTEQTVADIGSFFNIDSSKNQPSDKPQSGKIDYDSASLQDITKVKNNAGEDGYRITIVDAEGKTETLEVFGEKSRIYDNAYPIFELAKSNPAFGEIYHKLVKPILSDLSKMQPQNTPENQPTPTGEK